MVFSIDQLISDLSPSVFFRVLSDGEEKFYNAKDLVSVLKTFRSLSRDMASHDEQMNHLQAQWTQRLADMDAVLTRIHGPVAVAVDDASVSSLVQTALEAGISSETLGLVTAESIEGHLAHFLTEEDIFPKETVVVLGQMAARYAGSLDRSVVIGAGAAKGGLVDLVDLTVLGANAQALTSGSTVLGNTKSQVHVASPVAVRADARDVASSVGLELGLEFVRLLEPVVARMDLREDYIDYASIPLPPDGPGAAPVKPDVAVGDPSHAAAFADYQEKLAPWLVVNAAYQKALAAWRVSYEAWRVANDPSGIVPDGTHARVGTQFLVTAQNLREAAGKLGVSFPGVLDGKASGGLDVLTVRETELIPVLVKAVKQLDTYVHSDAFADVMATRIFEKIQAHRLAAKMTARANQEISSE